MKSSALYHGLKVIEHIYDESQYGVNDLYRIKDLRHSLDANHWKSKEWLARTFKPIYDEVYGTGKGGNFYIAGGWYGLLADILKDYFPEDNYHVVSGDMDPMTDYYGELLFPERKFGFKVEDATGELDLSNVTALISTSVEHIDRDDICDLIRKKPENAFVVLQSNNYGDLDSHINCSPSLKEFVDWVRPCLSKGWICYQGALDLGDFVRYMVIAQ